jgi:DNA-binding ferritin-like protein
VVDLKLSRNQIRELIEMRVTNTKSSAAVKIPLGLLTPYLGSLRAVHLWFHAAHNLTKGTGFVGDHVHLYGQIYVELQDDLDAAIEKAIGLSGDERAGCPIELTAYALEILKLYPSPTNAKARDIVSTALELLHMHIDLLTELHDNLERRQLLTLGLDDLLAQAANRYEGYLYLLTQRSKNQLD